MVILVKNKWTYYLGFYEAHELQISGASYDSRLALFVTFFTSVGLFVRF